MPRLCLLALLALVPAGCGGGASAVPPPDYGSEDGRKIAEFVSRLDDARGDPARLRRLFAAPPANPRAYDRYLFSVQPGTVKVDGATATASVDVSAEADGRPVGTREWAFARAGDGWKLTAAPLPDGKK